MKKGVTILFSALFLAIFLIGIVSAVGDEGITDLIKSFVDAVIDLIKTYLAPLLGEENSVGSDMFMAKVLFFIVLVSFVYVTLSRSMQDFFNDKEWALWVVSIIVPAIGIRYLSAKWIATIILPNSVFVATIGCMIPFILFYFFTSRFVSPTARRIAWVGFAVVFFFMSFVSSAKLDSPIGAPIKQVYAVTAIAALLIVVFDGTIDRLKKRMEREKKLTTSQYFQYSRYLKRRDELEELLLHTPVASKAYGTLQTEITNIDRALKGLGF